MKLRKGNKKIIALVACVVVCAVVLCFGATSAPSLGVVFYSEKSVLGAGETFDVSVNLEGYDEMYATRKLSGAQVVLKYDSALLQCQGVTVDPAILAQSSNSPTEFYKVENGIIKFMCIDSALAGYTADVETLFTVQFAAKNKIANAAAAISVGLQDSATKVVLGDNAAAKIDNSYETLAPGNAKVTVGFGGANKVSRAKVSFYNLEDDYTVATPVYEREVTKSELTTLKDVPAGTYNVVVSKKNQTMLVYNNIVIDPTTPAKLSMYEFGSVTLYAGDITGDNLVNSSDYALLMSAYGKSNQVYDLNDDGKVNSADYTLLMGNYGKDYR